MVNKWVSSFAAMVFFFGVSGVACAAFNLGGGEDFAILYEGVGGHTLQVTNVTANGNIGVAATGKMTVSGPATVNGSISLSAANTNQFANNNASNVITGGVSYNVAAVTSSMNFANSLSQTLFNTNGTSVAINGTTTINASSGSTFTINGQEVHVFDASIFKNGGGQTLTISGSASDLVAINLDGLGNIQVQGGIVFTGGITADNVLFNVGGGNYATQTGGSGLGINNNGGKGGTAQGIFLNPNGTVNMTNAIVLGRAFGGGTQDFQFVSGSSITAPATVPDAGATVALLGLALVGIEGMRRLIHARQTRRA